MHPSGLGILPQLGTVWGLGLLSLPPEYSSRTLRVYRPLKRDIPS